MYGGAFSEPAIFFSEGLFLAADDTTEEGYAFSKGRETVVSHDSDESESGKDATGNYAG